jgi:hypothetical protein
MIPNLQAILKGSRDPDLATDPSSDYNVAAGLRLMLESPAST